MPRAHPEPTPSPQALPLDGTTGSGASLSRRTLLRGLGAAGATLFAGRLFSPTGALAHPAATGTALLTSTLEAPIDTTGRLLHGAWIWPGPGSSQWSSELGNHVNDVNGAGHTPAIINFFKSWLATSSTAFAFPASQLNAVLALGAIPMLTWQPWNSGLTAGDSNQATYSWTSVKNGAYDAQITAFANAAANFGHPFFLRFAHEMNTQTYSWGADVQGNPADGLPKAETTTTPAKAGYAEYFRHVRYLLDAAGASNVLWTWAPNIGPSGSNAFNLLSRMYPGDDAVHWLGLDGYNGYRCYNPAWRKYNLLYDDSINELNRIAPDKPIMIAENGCNDPSVAYNSYSFEPDWATATQTTTQHHKGLWFTDYFAAAKFDVTSRNLRATCYFSENKAGNWKIDDTTPAKAADYYRTALTDAAVGHAVATASARISTLSDTFTPPKPSPNPKWSSLSSSTVTYQAGTSTAPSYASIPCDSSYAILQSAVAYRLNSDGAYVQVLGPLPAAGTSQLKLKDSGSSDELSISCTPGSRLSFQYIKNTVSSTPQLITYDESAHKWWRIREAAGFTSWETSPDATLPKPIWTRQLRVYNLFRDRTFIVQFKTGCPSSAPTQLPFRVANFNTGRKTDRVV